MLLKETYKNRYVKDPLSYIKNVKNYFNVLCRSIIAQKTQTYDVAI